ncbi:lipopolysaccharide biosynthesis protein [Fibrobacter succinogenes]|uniref:Membrane protein involved in the export of O-antigen and teichoic acid n=1 Tax=Fibrobacter succinogenes TaxID=833 RepID=A0A380RUN4_FIBSU|nr:lipopolysaccharide biosynthesis protein [Fibrobacter succinogenes]PWJ37000.1 O-antigen/teichoic acid export membrane protein [Fibrobacter succinogenes subsp. elongatus]SUQ19248.1 Membrane protein involved in the export of O-antigen and teichoic acid [Fibrobacter succinogenes]
MNSKIFSGIGWSFAERVSAQLVSFIVSIILARILAPEDYGILAIVSVFIAIGDALVTGGFGIALVQKKNSNEADFNSICWVSVAISMLLYLILFFCAPFISLFYKNMELTLIIRVLGVRLLFSAINSIQLAFVQKKLLFKKNCIIATVGIAISGVLGIFLAETGAGVWALIVQNLSSVAITTVLLMFFIEWKPKFQFSFGSVKELWGYGSKMFLATTVDTIKDNIRTLVVGKIFSSADLAYYNQGMRFPRLLVNDIVNSVGKVLLPVFSERQDDLKKNTYYMRQSIRISSFILLPLIFGLIGTADNFIMLLLSEKWMPCVPYLRILSLVFITRSINTILKNALLAIGKSGINLFHEITTSVLTIILIFIAALYYRNISFIAWSYVVVSIVGTIIFSFFTIKNYPYKVQELIKDYLPSLLLSCFVCTFVYVLGMLDLPILLEFTLQIVMGGIIYIGASWLLKMNEFQYIMQRIKKK